MPKLLASSISWFSYWAWKLQKAKSVLAKPKVKFLMLRYINYRERLAISRSASRNYGEKSNLPWDWLIIFFVLGSLGLMSWGQFNQILTPVISIFFIIGLFFIYFFRISKWNIAGPIFKFNAKPELGWWREVSEGETYSQTGKPEPLAVGTNKTITLNLVDCLSCGHQVPVRSEKCMQCGAPYLISADN